MMPISEGVIDLACIALVKGGYYCLNRLSPFLFVRKKICVLSLKIIMCQNCPFPLELSLNSYFQGFPALKHTILTAEFTFKENKRYGTIDHTMIKIPANVHSNECH